MDEINELKRCGMSVQAISELTGYDRKTIRKYLLKPVVPAYRSRPAAANKLEPFKPYLNERLQRESGTRRCCCGNCGNATTRAATRF